MHLAKLRPQPSTCGGQAVATPTCFIRESTPSMCKTVTLGSSTNIRVAPTAPVPGAQYLNIYVAAGASCSGLAYLTRVQNTTNSSVIINSSTFPAGWPAGAATRPNHANYT